MYKRQVYIVGSVIGTVFISILASIVASWHIFDPIALGMACGVGSGSMMTAAAGTLGEIYPQQAENIMIMGCASAVSYTHLDVYKRQNE